MDPITHSLVGGLSADMLKSPRRRFWIFCFLGEAPDLDVFLSHLGPWAFFLQHRGLTHSLIGIVIQALFYAMIFSKWDKENTFIKRITLYSIPLCLHLLCDYLTSYGVPVFSPFSLANFQGDLITSVNLIPTLMMTLGYTVIKLKPALKKIIVTSMLGGWGLYLVFSFSMKRMIKDLDIHDNQAVAVPTLYNPFEWGLVVDDPVLKEYRCYRVNLLKRSDPTLTHVPSVQSDDAVEQSKTLPLVKDFFKENRWPVVAVEKTSTGSMVYWGSLLFSKRGLIRGKVRVIVNEQQHTMHAERYFGFWNPEIKK